MGSAMIYFMGYFGNILYSGDLWFHKNVIKNNNLLFDENEMVNFKIDELILDNTFCDPIF